MIDYRWSKLSPTFFGFHASLLLFAPMWFASFIFGPPWPWIVFIIAVLYAVYLFIGQRKKFGPVEFARYLWCRFVLRFEWKVREW